MSNLEKDIFIQAVKSIEVNGLNSIPTTLFYGNNIEIGHNAISKADSRMLLNEDFKIDLGNVDPKKIHSYKTFTTAKGDKVSALQLTNDYFRELFKHIKNWLSEHDTSNTPNILIAEPLSLKSDIVEEKWLGKYRSNIKRIMSGSYFGFDNISFLPEPFAVFQYYRYGLQHPNLMNGAKNNALVIDFGGGTFDVCIIETTKKGNVRIGGKNSRPLAASSVAVGGYYINRCIVEHLLRKVSNGPIANGIKLYKRWRKDIEISDLSEKNKNFIKNFHNQIYEIENTKLELCKKISNWDLEHNPGVSVPVSISKDPFSDSGEKVNIAFSSKEFFQIFKDKVWNPHLKKTISNALKRGEDELKGESITVILLSGGSSNIGWLKEFISSEFKDNIGHISILSIPNFQDVVSNGLAIECARRFFTDDKQGDFSAVTYNRLHLLLNPDDSEIEAKSFKTKTEGLPNVKDMPGVLLPSASDVKDFIGNPMLWRVKLHKRPTKKLDYFFLRSFSGDLSQDEPMNVVNQTVHTPSNCKSDSSIEIQLTIKSDGIAFPRFIYKRGKDGDEIIAKDARPFPIDMTCEQNVSTTSYIGLDFGTSNSSISYVDDKSIQFINANTNNKSWVDTSLLADHLPYPLSLTLSKYLSETNIKNRMNYAREFIEMSLTLMAYVAYLFYLHEQNKKKTKIFKSFTKRSAGPLWRLLQDSLMKLKKDSSVRIYMKELMEKGKNYELIDGTINNLADYKHEKIKENSFEVSQPIKILTNICNNLFTEYVFGYFDYIQSKKFKKHGFEGNFRVAHGKPPFVNILKYEGKNSFPSNEAVLINKKEGVIVPLYPLIFWNECSEHTDICDAGHCFVYDIKKQGGYSFKAAGFSCVCDVNESNDYEEIANSLAELSEEDQKVEFYEDAIFFEQAL